MRGGGGKERGGRAAAGGEGEGEKENNEDDGCFASSYICVVATLHPHQCWPVSTSVGNKAFASTLYPIASASTGCTTFA